MLTNNKITLSGSLPITKEEEAAFSMCGSRKTTTILGREYIAYTTDASSDGTFTARMVEIVEAECPTIDDTMLDWNEELTIDDGQVESVEVLKVLKDERAVLLINFISGSQTSYLAETDGHLNYCDAGWYVANKPKDPIKIDRDRILAQILKADTNSMDNTIHIEYPLLAKIIFNEGQCP